MKYALLSDLHSNTADTLAVLEHINSLNEPVEILALGDLFECKISKKKAQKQRNLRLQDALLYTSDFIHTLHFPSIIGNQELRIMKVTGKPLFNHLSEQMQIEGATLIHGHQFEWIDDYTPKHKKYKNPLVFFGHSHHSALFRKGNPIEFTFSMPIQLVKKRYSINVGSVLFHREWCLYDSVQRTVTFMKAEGGD